MKKYIIVIILLFSLFYSTCHKKLQNDILINQSVQTINNETIKINELLKINISGNYGWNMDNYEYEIKTIENEHSLTMTLNRILYYKRVLSDNEMYSIYSFINEYEIEQEIKKRSDWYGSHDFEGLINISINNKIYEIEIYSRQDFDNNLYRILNFLDSFIDENNCKMPIIGVGKNIR